MRTIAILAAWAAWATTSAAMAADPTSTPSTARPLPPGAFDRVKQRTLQVLRDNQKRYADRQAELAARDRASAAAAGMAHVGSPRTGVTQANSVTAAAIATAAIGTDVQGAKAGVTVSPLLLAGIASAHQVKVTLATLDDGKTRAGLAYSYEDVWDPNTYAALGLAPCAPTAAGWRALERMVDRQEESFTRVCEGIVAFLPPEPGKDNAYAAARWACGYEAAPSGAEPVLNLAAERVRAAIDAAREEHVAALPAIVRGASAEGPALRELDAFTVPTLDACLSDETLARAYAQKQFERSDWRFGAGTLFEFLPWQGGFNADSSTRLTRGEAVRLQAKPEVSVRYQRLEAFLAAGVGGVRDSGREDFRLVLSPTFGVSWIIGSIGREPFEQDGKVLFHGGFLGPHVLVGLAASADWAPNPPAHRTQVEAVEATPHLDLKFTKELVVRLGVPVKAKLATRAADKPGGPWSGLQWTAPISVFAILQK